MALEIARWGFGYRSLFKVFRPAPRCHRRQRYCIPRGGQCRRSNAGGVVSRASAALLAQGCWDRLSLRPVQRAQSISPPRRFAPAAVAANKSLKPTPHHRCVQRSRLAVYRRLSTVALRRGLAQVLAAVSGSVASRWRTQSRAGLLPLFARRFSSARAVVAFAGSGIPYRPLVSAGARMDGGVGSYRRLHGLASGCSDRFSLRPAQRAQKHFAACRGSRPLPLQLTSRSSRRRFVASLNLSGPLASSAPESPRSGAA